MASGPQPGDVPEEGRPSVGGGGDLAPRLALGAAGIVAAACAVLAGLDDQTGAVGPALVACSCVLVGSIRIFGASPRPSLTFVAVMVTLLLGTAAAQLGVGFGASNDAARGRWRSGPVAGIHPMQHFALVIDGFGPHDVVVPAHVDPSGQRGPSPEGVAALLERQVRAVGERQYPADSSPRLAFASAHGRPTAARIAWSQATVTAVPAAADDGSETFELEIQSGGRGPLATVRGVCPSSTSVRSASQDFRQCPSRYAYPGDAGLGMRARWGAVASDGTGPSKWFTAGLTIVALGLCVVGLRSAPTSAQRQWSMRCASGGLLGLAVLSLAVMAVVEWGGAAATGDLLGVTVDRYAHWAGVTDGAGYLRIGAAVWAWHAFSWLFVAAGAGGLALSRGPRVRAHA